MAESDYGVSGSGAFWAPIQKRIEQNHSDEEALKAQKRSFYSDIAANPNSSDDVRNWAVGEHAKLLNPDTAKKLKQAHPAMHAISRLFGGSADAQPQQPSGPVPAPMPGQVYDTAAANKRSLDLLKEKSDIEQARQEAVARAHAATGTMRTDQEALLPDGTTIPLLQSSKNGQYFTQDRQPYELPEGAVARKVTPPGTMQKVWAKYPDDKKDDPPHLVYVDPKNPSKKLDANTAKPVPEGANFVDESALVAQIRTNGYGTGEINSLAKGLEGLGYSPEQAQSIAGERYVADKLNQYSLRGAQRYSPANVNVGGQSVQVPGGPVRAPIAPLPAIQDASQAPAPPAAVPGATPHLAPPTGPRPAPGIAPKAAPAVPGGAAPTARGRVLPGVPQGQFEREQQKATALSAAITPLFGDPSQPGLTPLSSYADLARDPASVKRIGEATKILAMVGDEGLGGAHASIGGGGVSLGLNGISEAIQNKTGVTQSVAQQRAEMLQKALSSMTPREREYYNALLTAREGIVGLRKASTGSGAKFAVDRMEAALPAIGSNVIDEAGYRDLIKRQAGIGVENARGIQGGALTKEQQAQFDSLKPFTSGPAKAPESKPAPPKKGDTVDGYIFQGGDPADPKSWKKK